MGREVKAITVAAAVIMTCTPPFPAYAQTADTRGAVLERVSHCIVLPEGRAWLDCFYGAAEPARRALELPPAPQAAQFQQVYAMKSNSGRPAAIPAEVLERTAHCGILPEGRAWLDCFYGAAQPARQALGLSPAPQALQFQQVYAEPLSQAAPAVASKQEDDSPSLFNVFHSPKVPPDRFGLKGAKPGPGLNVDRIVDRIANVQAAGTGFIVTLANGQVWKQVDATPVSWRAHNAGYMAIITHGAFNTFYLRRQVGKDPESDVYEVARIR
jgi:hypothetical protein